ARSADGQAVYSGLLNDRGGFVDDVVAYRFSPERILICVNASNREKDFRWMSERTSGVKPINRSDDYAHLALQGPKPAAILQRKTAAALSYLRSSRFTEAEQAAMPVILSRHAYTGRAGSQHS